MNNQDQFKTVLEKYKFTEPVPFNVQDEVSRARKDTLISILKKKKKYSIFALLVISFYFWIKKTGITITITNVIIATMTAATVTVGAVSYGTYYTVKKIIFKKQVEEKIKEKKGTEKEKPESIEKKDEKTKTPEKDQTTKIIPPKPEIHFAIVPFEADSNNALSKEVSKLVFSELQNIKGKGRILLTNKNDAKNRAKNIILGSITKLGETYRISVRIVDSKSSKLVGFFTEKSNSEKGLKDACRNISVKIAQKVK